MIPFPQPSDPFKYSDSGLMTFDGIPLPELIDQFGSPMQIYSELAIRSNITQMSDILRGAWGTQFNIKYSIKSTGSLEIATICVSAGCGLECFGLGELEIALASGIKPNRILLNGSAKNRATLERAASAQVTISIDNLTDVQNLIHILNKDLTGINFYIRAKLVPDISDHLPETAKAELSDLITFAQQEKWGASLGLSNQIYSQMVAHGAKFEGINVHLGRVLKEDWSFEYWGRLFGKYLNRFIAATNAELRNIDIGGGWTRQRDPMPNALLARLGADFGLPQFIKAMQPQLPEFAKNPILEVETGRFIVGNAAVAITEVVNKKVDLEVGWLHVDISTNFLVRIDTSKYRYAVLPVLESTKTEKSIRVVGETCIDSTIEPIFNYINVKPGELLAILDTGMYTMSTANNFNTVEKPIALLNTSSDGIKVLKY